MTLSWYHRNRQRQNQRTAQNRKNTRAWFREHKKTLSCIKCGQNHPATLDFHHVFKLPTNRKVQEMLNNNCSRQNILDELRKCVVLCSNCHRIHHYNEKVDKYSDTHTLHIPTTYTGNLTMFDKIKAFFKGKETKTEEHKEKANTSAPQYAAVEKREPAKKPAAKPVQKTVKPAPRKPVAPAKKPAAKPQAKPAQKRGK